MGINLLGFYPSIQLGYFLYVELETIQLRLQATDLVIQSIYLILWCCSLIKLFRYFLSSTNSEFRRL